MNESSQSVEEALDGVARALHRLGTNDAGTRMGGLEALGVLLADSLEKIASSIDGLAEAVDRLAEKEG